MADKPFNNSIRKFNETVREAVKRMCDEIFLDSQYAGKFEAVDDDFSYPNITYFNEVGDALQINHLTRFITFYPKGASGMAPRTVPLQDVRDLLYALEGAALSLYAREYEDSGADVDGVPLLHFVGKTKIEGDNLFELFSDLLSRHQDEGTREHFQAELKRLNGDLK